MKNKICFFTFSLLPMDILLQSLISLTGLEEKAVSPLLHFFDPVRIPAKAILLEPGSISGKAWFVGQGLLRAYYIAQEQKRSFVTEDDTHQSREVTNWVVQEGGFLTDFKSFFRQIPATYYIESIEPCRLYKLDYKNYLQIQKSFPGITGIIIEHIVSTADLRIQMCNLRSPVSRLEMFEQMHPGLSGRMSVAVQATYLNIDRTTLSRLRGKMK